MKLEKKIILFHFFSPYHFEHTYDLIKDILKFRSNYEIYLSFDYYVNPNEIKKKIYKKVNIINFQKYYFNNLFYKFHKTVNERIQNKIYYKLLKKRNFFKILKSFFYHFISYLFYNSLSKRIFKEIKPNLIIINDDRNVQFSNFLLKQSKKFNVKSVCINNFLVNPNYSILNRNRDLESFADKNSFSFKNLIFKKQNKFIHKDKIFFFYKIEKYFVSLFFNVLPKFPWVNGSSVDYIFVDNKYSKQSLENYKIKGLKIFFTGLPIDKKINSFNLNSIKNLKLRKILESNNKKYLINMPHLSEHYVCSEEDHFNYIKEIIYKLKNIKGIKLLSFHPRSKKTFIKYASSIIDKNFIILSINLNKVIKYCDVFFSCWSTTINRALNFNIPVVIFNYFDIPIYGCEIYKKKVFFINKTSDINSKIVEKIMAYKKSNIIKKEFNLKELIKKIDMCLHYKINYN